MALVASGSASREAGVQLSLIDVLVDAGADPNALPAAFAHRETAAAEHLLSRGARPTLLAAACLNRLDELECLAPGARADERGVAVAGAAIYGQADALRALLGHGAEANGYCPEGFHAHSTPLHQAVFSGSTAAVGALVDAGADLTARDRAFDSTPLGWAEYGGLPEIATYLRSVGPAEA